METQDILTREASAGGSQSGLRDRNARLVLSVLRRHGALSGAEIARKCGLTAQTVSNILRALETDEIVQREDAIKGKVGKPSIPISLNPRGVYSLGLNIGRRSAELVLVDFNGKPIDRHAIAYPYPVIETVFDFLARGLADIRQNHPRAASRLAGIGVGRPFEIWSWLEVVDAPEEAMRAWMDLDLPAHVSETTGLEVIRHNDATAACIGEHLLGRGNEFSNFAYFFVGAFIGGGLVLDGKVISGPTGNAGAFGALRVPRPDGGTTQLLNVASLHVLEHDLQRAGIDPDQLRDPTLDWSDYDRWVGPWIEKTAENLAIAAITATSVVEIEAVLVDGAMPERVRNELVSSIRQQVALYTPTGIKSPAIEAAAVGRHARSMGAAMLPIHAKYFLA